MNRKARRAAAKALAKSLRAQGVSKAERRQQVAQARRGATGAIRSTQASSTLKRAVFQRGQAEVQRRQQAQSIGQRRAREAQLISRVEAGEWKVGSFLRRATEVWRESTEYSHGERKMMPWLSQEAERRGYSSITEWEKAYEEENAKMLQSVEDDAIMSSAEDPYAIGMDLATMAGGGTLPSKK